MRSERLARTARQGIEGYPKTPTPFDHRLQL
nr:MAG TPA_asm: hypothetical protein [Caudoviricetes sp.]